METQNQNTQDINAIYEEVCRAHDGIADFRAKLLALLPIASGAGIFLLVPNQPENAELSHLLPVGVFGVLITMGLFLYELRGIQKCNALIESAKRIEHRLAPELGALGTFNIRPDGVLRGFAGATGAALVIYPSVLGAWIYVAGVGWAKSLDRSIWVMVAAAAAAIGALIGGRIADGILSHVRLHWRGFRSNPGLKSTPFYFVEALVLAVLFFPGLSDRPVWAAVGLAAGVFGFWVVLPGLRLARKIPVESLQALREEPWEPWQPRPEWAR